MKVLLSIITKIISCSLIPPIFLRFYTIRVKRASVWVFLARVHSLERTSRGVTYCAHTDTLHFAPSPLQSCLLDPVVTLDCDTTGPLRCHLPNS